MKKRILSIVLMLALAFSLAIGTAVISNAAAGDASIALNLAENITVQVKFESWADTAASAVIQIDERTPATVIPVKDGYDAIVEIPVPVKDLDADVKVTLYTADGVVLAEKTVNAAAYCESLAGDATYGALVEALKAYSAVAKSYFANDGTLVAPDADPDFGESTYKTEGTLPAGLTHDSATLILESETTIRHYFLLADDYSIGSYRFWVDLDEDGGFDIDEQLTVVNAGDAYCVDISGITPNDLDKAYTLYVTDFNDTYSCTYGALDYAARKYESGEADAKALTAALNNYLAEAAKIGANIVYMDGETELKTELYNYGVDNYITYAPEKDGVFFAGWTDADGKKVNVIADGTVGNVTLYANWESAPETPAFSGSSDAIAALIVNMLKDSTKEATTADGVTTIDISSLAVPKNASGSYQNRGNYPTVNGQNFALAFTSVSTYKYAKAEMQFGKVEGKAVLPFNMRILQEHQFFNIASDGGVYLGASQDANYKIAQLEDGILTDVEFYMDLSGCDFTFTNNNTVVLHATNMAGDAVSISCTGKWNSARTAIGQIMLDLAAHQALIEQECGIMIGNQAWIAVPALTEITSADTITDATTGAIYTYEAAKATRLPSNMAIANKAFAGWYADAECTQAINSIEKGNFGPVTVYSKWADADYYATAKNANGNHIKGNGYGDIIEEYNMCYTYTVRFDKSSSTDVSGQIRLRNSGLEAIVDEEGNVTYKDWAKYYQYIYTDPTHTFYVGLCFDEILEELGCELRAKDENGEYIMDTYTVIEKQTVTELQPKLDENDQPVLDENNEPIMEEVQVEKEVEVEKECHKIDEAAFELYYSKIMTYSPNSNNTQALRYAKGIVKTMNGKVLANVTKEDAIISFVLDFANLELRYYLNGVYFATEELVGRTADTPYDKGCNVFLDADGGLSNYNKYDSAQPFNFLNWQNTSGATLATEAFTFGDIYATTANVKYELNGGTVEGETVNEIAIGAELVLPETVTKDNHVFSGWYLDASFETPADGYVVPNSKNITVYAKLVELVTYNITYSAEGGTIADGEYTESFVPGYTDVVLPWVTKENTNFAGWYMDKSFNQKATASELAKATSDITLYALYVDSCWSKGAAIGGSEYWWGQANGGWSGGNIADAMIAAGVDTLTLRVDTASTGSENWVGSGVRLRPATGSGEAYVINFADGNMTSLNSGTVLTTPNSGDVVDVVIDFTNKTCTYYVNGVFVVKDTGASMGALTNYNYESVEGVENLSRGNMFQLTANSSNGRKLAYDSISIIFGDALNHVDADKNHVCDDCGLTMTTCTDATGDNDHDCDMCGKGNASACVDETGDGMCDECGYALNLPVINYNANGGVVTGDGYSTKIFPNATVVLPWATKGNECFIGWYLDAELTQRATQDALAAATEDVTLYAKYATSLKSADYTANTNDGAIYVGNYNDMWTADETLGYAVTHRLIANAIAADALRGFEIRCRNNANAAYVQEVWIAEDGIYATENGVKVGNVGDVVDVVMDFDDKTITYYCNGVLVEAATRTGLAFTDPSTYNFTGTSYVFCQMNNQNKDNGGITYFHYDTLIGNIYA